MVVVIIGSIVVIGEGGGGAGIDVEFGRFASSSIDGWRSSLLRRILKYLY